MVVPLAAKRRAILLIGAILLFTLPALMFAQQEIHIVGAGETLASIAEQYDVTEQQIADANGISVDAPLFIGQQLVIPLPAEEPEGGSPVPTSTPLGSTAGQVDDGSRVFEANPTAIPPTLTPTPLPYDPNAIVDIIEPDERFTVNLDPVPIRGVVQFDPATMAFWKIEIRGTSRRSQIGDDPMSTIPAFNWVTLDTRTDSVIDGQLGLIPPFPTLSEGSWFVRVVVVNGSGSFVAVEEVPFRVRPEFDPITAGLAQPAEGQIMQAGDPVIGTVNLTWATSSYRVELLGGNYSSWTIIENSVNDVANPTVINNGVLATLPADLVDGRYRLRLSVQGLDGNYIQAPIEVGFAVGTDEVSNLAEITIDEPRGMENGRVTITGNTQVIGTVRLADQNGFFKMEIKDADRLADGQAPRFTDWTTIGEPQYASVENGFIGEIVGAPFIAPGRYKLRIVVVDGGSQFSAVREFDMNVRE